MDSLRPSEKKNNWTLAIIGLLMMALVFAQLINLSSIFLEPVSEGLGVSRASFSLHQTIGLVMCIITSIYISRIMEFFGLKRMLVIAVITAGCCSFLYSFATSVWHFYMISAVMGCCVIMLGSPTISIIINSAYPENLRGTANGIAMSGSGFGAMVLSPILSAVNGSIGWRWSYRLMGTLVLVILLPLVLTKTDGLELKNDTSGAVSRRGNASAVRRSGLFFYVFFLIIYIGFVYSIFNTAGYAYFCDCGLPDRTAATAFSVVAASLMIGKLLLGVVCDRIGNRKGIIIAATMHFLSLSSFALMSGMKWMIVPGILMYGFGNALCSTGLPLLITDMFGAANYRDVSGFQLSGFFIGTAVGPPLVSRLYDMNGSFVPALVMAVVMNFVLVPLILIAYRQSRKAVTINKS